MNDVNSELAQETTGTVKNEKSHTELQTGIKMMGVCVVGRCTQTLSSLSLPCVMFMSGVEDRRVKR